MNKDLKKALIEEADAIMELSTKEVFEYTTQYSQQMASIAKELKAKSDSTDSIAHLYITLTDMISIAVLHIMKLNNALSQHALDSNDTTIICYDDTTMESLVLILHAFLPAFHLLIKRMTIIMNDPARHSDETDNVYVELAYNFICHISDWLNGEDLLKHISDVNVISEYEKLKQHVEYVLSLVQAD